MVTAINQGMFTNQPSTPSSGFVFAVGNQVFNTIEEAKRYLAQNPQAGTISRVPFQTTTSGMLNVVTTPVIRAPATPPKTPPKQMPGDSGPIIANPGGTTIPIPAPAPAPAPAPQTGPVGIPSSDPTKTQPGETGPFDPNAEPPSPAPAPEPEAELAPPKPLQDTKEPAPEPEGITTFTFFRGDEMGDANPAALYNRGDSVEFTQDQLEEYFNEEGSGMLRQAFGSFSNYLGYMTEREQLIQSGDYDVGDWPDYQGGLTDDELMLLEGEDLTQFGDDAASDIPELEQRRLLEQSSAYDRWVNSEANQALLKKYGVNSISYNQDGDKFEWNGSAFVKTVKVDDHAGVGDYVKAGILTAMTYFAGGPLTEALTNAGMSATLASGTSSGILNAATQYASTGEVDFGDALDSAISAGLSTEIINQLTEAGVFEQLEESLNNLTQDTVQLADGTELPYNGISVELADGSTVAIGDFLTQAAEAGNPVVAEITRSLPEFLDTIADAFEASGAAQGVVNILEGMTTETQPYPGSQSPQVTINVPSGGRDIFTGGDGVDEETPVEEDQDPDILADTTQEATGLEESVLSDLLDEYLEPIRGEITQSEERIISQTQEFIANAIANLPPNATQEEIRAIVQDVIQNAPQAETLSEEQVDVLVNSAVDAVRVDLQTGLETAETERQEIIAGQQAIRSELSDDIEALQTTVDNLPPEIRTIVSEEIENLATTSDVNAVQQSINALEQLVNNIQPGTTPEQVRQEIQDAGLATSQEVESRIVASEERVGERITGLEERMDVNAIQQLSQLTGLRTEFLETLSASEAAAIARNQGLSDQITEEITGVRGETAAQIEGINERLTERISEYEAQTGEQLDIAAEERAVLGGQLGTLTSDVAQVAEDLIRADGRIEELDEASRERFDELGLSIEDLSLRVGVNLEALQTGMLTQDAALRELIEESTTQTEESLTQRLEQAEEGFATSLSDTEANLLSQITGVEAGVLQQLAEVEGGLQSQFGEQFGQVQEQVAGLGEQVSGIGEQVAGVGEGLGQLGQAIGTGLLGLAAAQPTAQQIASAMPRQPVKFDPFLKGLDPFQPLTPLTLRPIQEKDAVSELNKFIGRQTGMLV